MNFEQPIIPNGGPWPSMIGNNPELSPFLGAGDLMLGPVSEYTAIASGDGKTNYVPQGPITELMDLRSKFPFLPIMPMPPQTAVAFLPSAGVAVEMVIPDAVVMGMFSYSVYTLASVHGNAEVPSALNVGDGANKTKSFVIPDKTFMYLGGLSTISFVSPTAGAIVTAIFYAPDQFPSM